MVPQWFVFMVYSVPALGMLLGLILAIRQFTAGEEHQAQLDGVIPEHHPFLLMKRIVSRRVIQRSAMSLPKVPGYIAQPLTAPAPKQR
jgi:hypothetical protein